MVDLLRVDTPVTGSENASRLKPHQNPQQDQLYNVADPSRVSKTQDQNVNADRQPNQYAPNMDSNFDKFMQAVRSLTSLTETYGEIFFSKLGSQVNAGLSSNFTEELAQYMNLLKMTDKELLHFLKNQKSSAVKFSGPFFDLLRQAIKESGSSELKGTILDFLRRYDSMTSGNHILKNMVSNLKNIAINMPQSRGTQLNGMIEKLELQHLNGQNSNNLAILKNEILPFLANYVSSTKDFGMARDIMAVLTLNIARYESGEKEAFLQSFFTLMGFREISRKLPGVDLEALKNRLMNTDALNENTNLLDHLVGIISKGMNGAAGVESKAIFENMLSSLLLNESVYMPLVHMTIPAEVNGRQFFSEVWIDPDDQSEKGGNGGRAIKILVKFDIRDLGYFEMILLSKDGKVDLELYYPEILAQKEKEISQGISEIITRNQLSFRTFVLGKCVSPKSISEVFPKLYEGRNAINVTV
ncbi:hypothetical protein [Anaerovorax sp. IOR16]|uniref:hypothetical protein n=1 Tax=Anaerovorax sp. IOR16 TaxID=2773458 RepID=UPI0019D2FAE9|nr:hypothetical protein [Anaerovorax sp. IOR16]